MFCALRRTRAGTFFQLPVLLVTTRLVVSLLFNTAYRIWGQTRNGVDALQQVRSWKKAKLLILIERLWEVSGAQSDRTSPRFRIHPLIADQSA
jgi:hypothetical protein